MFYYKYATNTKLLFDIFILKEFKWLKMETQV